MFDEQTLTPVTERISNRYWKVSFFFESWVERFDRKVNTCGIYITI